MGRVEKLGRIGVLMGGYSSEREISLRSGTAIFDALKTAGCNVVAIDIREKNHKKISQAIRDYKIDVALIALHGELGEDGQIQAILNRLKIPFNGSDVAASQKALNKTSAKQCFEKMRVPTPKYFVIKRNKKYDVAKIILFFGNSPIVVKPSHEGSSIGIKIVRDIKYLADSIKEALNFGHDVLLEEFIVGRELTVGILKDKALPVVEIRPKNKYFDFEAKYQKGMSKYLVPAPLDLKLRNKIQKHAVLAHKALGCKDFSRVDFMLSDDSKDYVLEVNTIPGFTAMSLLPKAAQEAGINFTQLCIQLIELAYAKKK